MASEKYLSINPERRTPLARPVKGKLFLVVKTDDTVVLRNWEGAETTIGVAPVAASLTTAFSGTNNDLTFTAVTPGAAGNDIAVRIVLSEGKYTDPDIAVVGGAIEITFGDKARMVYGEEGLTDGTNPVVFDDMSYSGMLNGKPAYSSQNGSQYVRWGGASWILMDETSAASWNSNEDTVTPDLAGAGFAPSPPATGFPSISPRYHIATQLKTAIEGSAEAAALITVANAPGNDGTGEVNTQALTNLSGGVG